MSTFAEGLLALGMRAAGLAVSPWMVLAAGMDTDTEDDGRKMLAAATDRNEARGGARSGEKEAAGVTGSVLGRRCRRAPAMPRALPGAAGTLGVDGISFTVHP